MNKIGVYFGRPATFVKDTNNYYDHLYFTKGSYFINSKKNNIDKFDSLSLFKNIFNTQIEHYNKKYTVYKTWQEFYDDIDTVYVSGLHWSREHPVDQKVFIILSEHKTDSSFYGKDKFKSKTTKTCKI